MSNASNAQSRESLRRRYLAVDTSNVCDVLDEIGYPDQSLAADIGRYVGSTLAGWAYTIRGQMTPYKGGGDAQKMEACGGIGAGEVSVWSGDGEGICYFGELIALGMRERGSVGAVIDGGIRDIKWLSRIDDYSVYAKYRTPTQSIGRWRVNGWQEPVYVRGATSETVVVHPGDLILGDEDGLVVIPQGITAEVLEKAEALTQKEITIRSELAKGLTLKEALKQFGHV
ncbi:RraA family protein [Bradyrhizobium mercantei]|uniref:RraA family protein n=1 Tax=Bradyrhizobium mercantei TaxID=1904807 RepID=UPI0009783847|nr:RraA family protein [Bradyrhizobium mercantei]